jgi:GPH family glycoside/pentoside/hexuronide:cation symporter
LTIEQLQASIVSVILLLGRVADAISDPMAGYLSSRTKTRWGSLRPWVGGAMLPLALMSAFCFSTHFPFEISQLIPCLVVML